jgi:hypothetical protein
LSPGARPGPYEVLAPAGAGGMGGNYEARDRRLEPQFAWRVPPPRVTSTSGNRSWSLMGAMRQRYRYLSVRAKQEATREGKVSKGRAR